MGSPRTNEEAKVEAQPLEDLTFYPSSAITLGVELELQVLDRDTGDLAAGSVPILQACADEGIEAVTAELMQSMIEVKTGVCRDVAEVGDTLRPLLRRVRHIAHSLGYDLALSGTHPFSHTGNTALFPAPRYWQMQQRMGGLTYQFVVFGLHVHVGMPDGDAAMGVANALVRYLPHLLALSANSPFWEGRDTCLVSARAALFGASPRAGIPQHFPGWEAFCEYCRVMYECGGICATKDIHWDIRPRPHLGTAEFRICDVPTTLAEALGLVALIHCLASEALYTGSSRAGDPRLFWIAKENKWQATRHGLRAECVSAPGTPRRRLVEELAELFERLRPLAHELNEAAFLSVFEPLHQFATGAERQRRLYREADDWEKVIEHTRHAWVEELQDTPDQVLSAGQRHPPQGI
jgi:carboxylate-amine ligase